MRKIIVITVIIIFYVSCSSPSKDKIDLVEQYMYVTEVDKIVEQYSYAYTTEAKRLYTHLPDSFWESKKYLKIMDEYEKELWKEWKDVYSSKITENDLKQLIGFLNTDLGRKFLNIQKDTQPYFNEVTLKVASKLNDNFAELTKNYEAR